MDCAKEGELIHPDTHSTNNEIARRHANVPAAMTLEVCKEEEEE
jgi:hypothetical protein